MAPYKRWGRRALAAALVILPPVIHGGLTAAADEPPAAPPPVRVNDRPPPNSGAPVYVTPAMLQKPDPPLPDLLPQPPPGPPQAAPSGPEPEPTKLYPVAPPGFTGPSGILPVELQTAPQAVPIEDRWRIPFPFWDRAQLGFPRTVDYPFRPTQGWFDSFDQNVLKGDYPIIGQHTFLEITASDVMLLEGRQLPTATTPFESTERPNQFEFFGKPNSFLYSNYVSVAFDLFHGDAAFKPADWRVLVRPVFNVNYLAAEELAVVSPDVRKGVTRGRSYWSLEEWFLEAKLADLSPDYDFMSVRVGSQPFTSDFRGFIFSDVNRAARLFGTLESNRDQFNLIFFDQAEKDTNSGLNTFDDRSQYVFIANFFRQDFLFPGYTAEVSLHYNHDQPSTRYDSNGFLVRPDPVGVFQPHKLDVGYAGFAGDGHIGRYNITNATYWAFGHDSLNPMANQPQDISAWMTAVELSYDRDWARFRTSYLYGSGDRDPNNSHATGFDSIMDNPNFAGGEFSFFQRQGIPLFGVNVTQRNSLLVDLRSSKIQGQSNFVNPGLHLFNLGVDYDLTPKLKMINNVNFLWFDQTQVLEQFLFDGHINNFIGTDMSMGFKYRPFLSNRAVITAGIAGLLPGAGFHDLYDKLGSRAIPLGQLFTEVNLNF
jgi:hypothetical protein